MIVTKQLEENPPPPQLIWEPRPRKYLDKLNPWVLSLVIMFLQLVGYIWLNPEFSFKRGEGVGDLFNEILILR